MMNLGAETFALKIFELGGGIPRIGNAREAWRTRQGLWLRLGDAEGPAGWGEAAPLPGYSRESLGEVRSALDAWKPPRSLEVDDPAASLAALTRQLPPIAAARFAIETAWLDVMARRQGEPLHRLLGGRSEALPIATLITELEPERAVAQAEQAERRGLRHFKFKIGRPGRWREELEVLRALRQTGRERVLRLDANGALPIAELASRLEALAEFEPEFIEEPILARDLIALEHRASPESWQAIGVPWALDESLQDPSILDPLRPWLDAGLFKAWVLKPMALGGWTACFDLATRARSLGIPTLVSHLFDGPVALAACCALALAVPGERLAGGLDPHSALTAWPSIEQPALRDGWIVPTERPGLGIEVSW